MRGTELTHEALPCSGGLSSTPGCAVSTGGSLVFGPNAVCRYFSYKGSRPPSPKETGADPAGAVEEWLDWEAEKLAPAERLLASSSAEGDRSLPLEVLEALEHLEERVTGTWLLGGVRQSSALDDGLLVAGAPNPIVYFVVGTSWDHLKCECQRCRMGRTKWLR